MFLLSPPIDFGSKRLQRSERSLPENAQQIDVRVIGNIISRSRRSVKNHSAQIGAGGCAYPFEKLVYQFFGNHFAPLVWSSMMWLPLLPITSSTTSTGAMLPQSEQ